MTPFEQGYKAFLDGAVIDKNPYSAETHPYHQKRWGEGWKKAQANRRIW